MAATPPNVHPRVQRADWARRRFGSLAEPVFRAVDRCDPLADTLVGYLMDEERSFDIERGWRDYRAGTLQLEPALALFAEVAATPPWVDWTRIERAPRLFQRSAMFGALVLKYRSLLAGYASPAGTKPLMFTGRLQEQTARRLAETTRFVTAVCAPGGMRPGGEGWLISLQVRLMHAQVRRLLRASGKWDGSRWGEPVNQHDMLGTKLLFSEVFIEGLRRCGFLVSQEEAEDWIHLWNLVAWLMGTDADLLPADHAQAVALSELIRGTQSVADDDGRALASALMRTAPPRLTDVSPRVERLRRRLSDELARMLVGDDIADQLALGRDRRARAVVRWMPRVVGLVERTRTRIPALDQPMLELGARQWRRIEHLVLQGVPADFRRPTRLRPHERARERSVTDRRPLRV